jgi:hypothetical protein
MNSEHRTYRSYSLWDLDVCRIRCLHCLRDRCNVIEGCWSVSYRLSTIPASLLRWTRQLSSLSWFLNIAYCYWHTDQIIPVQTFNFSRLDSCNMTEVQSILISFALFYRVRLGSTPLDSVRLVCQQSKNIRLYELCEFYTIAQD